MDLTIIRLNIKRIFTANFIFMGFAATVFGILSVFGTGSTNAIIQYSHAEMVWNGYIFLFIIFSCELSKDLLQTEKITGRVEWMVSNGIRVASILTNHAVSLWVSTVLLLAPLFALTSYYLGLPSPLQWTGFFTFSFLISMIINAGILAIRNMNKFKCITLSVSLFYFLMLIAEKIFLENFMIAGAIKYAAAFLTIFIILMTTSKERIITAYY